MTPNFIRGTETYFYNEFKLLYPDTPVFFSNVPVPDTLDTFVCFHIMASEDTVPINLGITAKSRNVGLLQIDVFIPKDIGTGSAYRMAYACGNIFKRKSLTVDTEGYAVFKDPAIQDRGQVRGRHKHLARIPYRYDFQDYVV